MQPCRTTDRQQRYWMVDQALKDDAQEDYTVQQIIQIMTSGSAQRKYAKKNNNIYKRTSVSGL